MAELFEILARERLKLLLALLRQLEWTRLASSGSATRIYIINNGHIVHEGPAQELKAQPELLQRYLGV